jgi:DNA-binding NtrC family response regulator
MKTILLVDDEYALVETLTELLQDEGYRVIAAANGKDGLTRASAENPDLVIHGSDDAYRQTGRSSCGECEPSRCSRPLPSS